MYTSGAGVVSGGGLGTPGIDLPVIQDRARIARKIPNEKETTMHWMHIVHLVASVSTSVWIFCLICLVIGVLYTLTLSSALRKCSVPSRTMRPGLVWLMLIPLFNIIWHFFVVVGLARSVGNEYQARRIPNAQRRPGMRVGIAMCICTVCAVLPFFVFYLLGKFDNQSATTEIPTWALQLLFLMLIGFLAEIAHLVLWIIYWSKIASCSRMLGRTSVVAAPPAFAPPA